MIPILLNPLIETPIRTVTAGRFPAIKSDVPSRGSTQTTASLVLNLSNGVSGF